MQYLSNRSLWLDEARLASNILARSFRQLLLPLGDNQAAPVGFLWLEKLTTRFLGESEPALRLVPLLAGIVSLLLFARVARRCLRPSAVPIAVGFFALCGPLIYYSSEAKQYSTDAFIALLLLDLALTARQDTTDRHRSLLALAAAGFASIWFSHPAVFALAAIGLTLGLSALKRRDTARRRLLAATVLLWLAGFTASYVWLLRPSTHSSYLLHYWDWAFMPLPPRSLADLRWFPRTLASLFAAPLGFGFQGVAILAFVVGSAACLAADRPRLSLLLAPALFALLASGLHLYPFADRLLLFLVPSLLLLVAEGGGEILEATRKGAPIVGITCLTLLFFQPVFHAVRSLGHPATREEIRPVLAYVRDHRRPADRIYLADGALPAFEYYSSRYGLSPQDATVGVRAKDRNSYREDLKKLPSGRTWTILSHVREIEGAGEETLLLDSLDGRGARLEEFHAPGAAVYLHDLDEHPVKPPPPGEPKA